MSLPDLDPHSRVGLPVKQWLCSQCQVCVLTDSSRSLSFSVSVLSNLTPMDPTKAVFDPMDMNSNSKPAVKKGNITGDSVVVGTPDSSIA